MVRLFASRDVQTGLFALAVAAFAAAGTSEAADAGDPGLPALMAPANAPAAAPDDGMEDIAEPVEDATVEGEPAAGEKPKLPPDDSAGDAGADAPDVAAPKP